MIPLLMLLFSAWLVIYVHRMNRRETRDRLASCAACRGERDGQVVLLPASADLCHEHASLRWRINRLETQTLDR